MAIRPVPDRITQRFGVKNSAYRLGYHPGVDYGSPTGKAIKATADGYVRYYSGNNGGYGNVAALVLKNGDAVWHSHLQKAGKTGNVRKGEVIGYTNSTGWVTGPHAHIEYRIGGSQNRPIDFEAWLRQHPEPKPQPAPKPAAKTYKLIVAVKGYVTAYDAKLRRNARVSVPAGNYYVFNQASGMVNVSRSVGQPGSWVNPGDNRAPTPQKPVYTAVRAGEGVSHLARRAGYADWHKDRRWQAITNLNKKGWSWQKFNSSLKVNQKVRVK